MPYFRIATVACTNKWSNSYEYYHFFKLFSDVFISGHWEKESVLGVAGL
jgi:hypothetical protein